ncbi:MAG: hypothetical protein ACJ73N_15830 [Bryobacteraceae bacterium]
MSTELQGLFRQFNFMEKNSPPADLLVVGPWTHGAFARGDGDHVSNVNFGSQTAVYFQEKIEFPFFLYYLKCQGDGKILKTWVFETGVNQWRRFDAWPPKTAKCTDLFLGRKGEFPGHNHQRRVLMNMCPTRRSRCRILAMY